MRTLQTILLAAFVALLGLPNSALAQLFNPEPAGGQVTKIEIRQGVPSGDENDWIPYIDRRKSVEFPVDRTGLIRIETQITHTFPNPISISLVDADGVIIDHKTGTNNPQFQFPPAKYQSPFFIRIKNEFGYPVYIVPITSGRSGHADSNRFQRETPSDSMASSNEYEESGQSDEGEYGEESSSGGCGECQSCDLSHSKEIDDIITDHPNGICGPGVGEGAATGTIPAGHSKSGDSKTSINFDIHFGSGVNMGDFKLHSLGDAVVTRDSSQQLASVKTDSSYTSLEVITGNKILIRHSSDPANFANTVFREIVFENSAANEITKTSTLYPNIYPNTSNSKSMVTIWRHPSAQIWECVIANGMRKKKITMETNNADLKVERHQIYERAAGASGEAAVLVSDVRKTFERNLSGWKKTKLEVLNENGGGALVTTWDYYSPTESEYSAGLLQTVTYPNGQVKQHTYTQPASPHLHEIKSSFANSASQTTEVRTVTPGSQGAQTTEIVKKDTTTGKNFEKITKQWITANQVVKKIYSSDSNITSQTSVDVIAFGNDFGGKVSSSVSTSDMGGGNAILTGYTQQLSRANGGETITQASGQMSTGNEVIDGESTQKAINADGVVLRSITTIIQPSGNGSANGAISQDALYSDLDALGRPRRVDYFPSGNNNVGVYSELRTYACCGAASRTDRYGVASYMDYDDLGRVIKTNTLGVTSATVYDGLTVHSHRYAGTVTGANWSGAPDGTNTLGRTTRNLQGTSTEEYYRSPQTGALVTVPNKTFRYFRNPAGTSTLPIGTPADVGMRTEEVLTPVADDEAIIPTQTTDYFRDGKVKESFGDIAPHRDNQYERNVDGLKVTVSYNDQGTLKESVITQYDFAGRPITTKQGLGTTSYNYASDKLTRVTDPDGVDTFYFYNAKGEQEKTVLDLDGDDAVNESNDQVTRSIRKPMMVTPPGGGTAIAVEGSVREVIVSGNSYVLAGESYSSFDGLLSWSVTPGNANPTVNVTALLGSGSWTETTTLPDGTQSKSTHTGGRLEKTQQRTNESTPAVITETTYGYDTVGRQETVTDKRTGLSTTAYINLYTDTANSITTAGDTTSYAYDHRGRRTLVNQPDTGGHANETTTKYFPNSNIKEVTGDQTYRSSYSHDYAFRRKTLVTYGTATATTTWNYSDSTGQLLSKRDNDGKGADYDYTLANRLKSRKWARGSFTRYDYDPAGRLAAKRYFLAAADSTDTNGGNDPNTGDVTFTYNRISQNLRAVTAAGGARPGFEVSTAYSATFFRTTQNGLIIDPDLTSTTADGTTAPSLQRTLHRKYDSLSRSEGYQLRQTSSITSALEAETTYRYSATNGRFAAVSSNPGGAGYSTTHDFIYGYETDSNLLKTTQSFLNYNFTTDTGTAIHQVTRAYEEDRDVLKSITNTKSSTNAVIAASDYTVNEIGQRTAITRSGSATSASAAYSYNNRGELIAADEATNTLDRAYQYDGIGNREKTVNGLVNDLPGTNNWTANALNQYTKANGVTLPTTPTPAPYDFDGNLRFDGGVNKDSENREYVWDGENRLIEIKNNSGSIQKNYYDAGNRKIATTANSVTTYYIYDGFNRIAEYTGTTLEKSYLWGMDLSGTMQGAGGVGGLLAVSEHTVVAQSPVVTTFYPTYDGNGNICEYLDDTGTSKAHYEYDAFGNVTFSSGDKAADFAYRFSTKPFDFITGWYYYLYRYYDPLTGRWPNRDPIEERGGINLYGFVKNEQIDKIDRLGMQCWVGPPGGPMYKIPTETPLPAGIGPCEVRLDITFIKPKLSWNPFLTDPTIVAAMWAQRTNPIDPFILIPDDLWLSDKLGGTFDYNIYFEYLQKIISEKLGKCCISGIDIRAHGNYGIGPFNSDSIVFPSVAEEKFLKWINSRKCKQRGDIILKACFCAGNSDNRMMMQKMANITEFDVIGWSKDYIVWGFGDKYKASPGGAAPTKQ